MARSNPESSAHKPTAVQQQPAQGEAVGATCYQQRRRQRLYRLLSVHVAPREIRFWDSFKRGQASGLHHRRGVLMHRESSRTESSHPPPAWTHVRPANRKHSFQLSQRSMTTSEPSGSIRRYVTNGAGCHRFLRSPCLSSQNFDHCRWWS